MDEDGEREDGQQFGGGGWKERREWKQGGR